jgi:IS30 family transposase
LLWYGRFLFLGGEVLKAKGKITTVLQLRIMELWADGHSVASIASALDCSEETVKNAKKLESVKQAYYERQNAQITELLPMAVKRLRDILRDDDIQASVQIAAIKEVFDRTHLDKLYENVDKEIKISIEYVGANNGDGEIQQNISGGE